MSLDTLARDIGYAFRTLRRAPLATVTIVATVALGLGLVTVVFQVYNIFFLRVDAVQRPSELFAVQRPPAPNSGAWIPFTRREYEVMRGESGVFTDAVAMLSPVRTRIDGRLVSSALVSGNFFQVLGVRPALGRLLMPEDDERSRSRRVIVLSHRGWTQLFAGEPTVIGRNVPINGVPYEVVGVMRDGFRGLRIGPPDYWAPLALAEHFREGSAGKDDDIIVEVVGRLKPDVAPEAAAAALAGWAYGRTDLKTAGRPAYFRLRPSQGTLAADVLEALLVFAPIFFAFGLILLIGCANVANLLLARCVSRQREIGIRLSVGATRRRIVRQLLTEGLLLALAAAACGLAISRLVLGGALYAVTETMPPELAEQVNLPLSAPVDWRVVVFLVFGAMVSTVFFALVPALHATRLELVRTVRGEVTRDARPNRARHALIAVQVAASALLLICAAVFLRSALATASVDPGIRTSDTVIVTIADELKRAALLQAVTAHPLVATLAASSSKPFAIAETSVRPGEGAGTRTEISRPSPVDEMAVSPEYFDVLDIAIVRGRGFTQAERTAAAGVMVVSETTARRLWEDRDPLGQVVRLNARNSSASVPARSFTVVVVARDVAGGFLNPFTFKGAYVPASAETPGTSLSLRVRGDVEQARLALTERLTRVDPGLRPISTMRTIAGMPTYILRVVFWVTVVLGGLALALTVSGLFSVLSYVVEQRAHEIGVRLALGATTRNVMRLVLSQSIRPVGIGLVAGGGLAAAVAIVLMSTRAASAVGSVVRVSDPLAYGASALIILSACLAAASIPALRAARIDPIATLRQD